MTKELLDRLNTATTEVAVLAGAIEFIENESCNAINSDDKKFCDVLYIVRQFSQKVACEMASLDIDMNRLTNNN